MFICILDARLLCTLCESYFLHDCLQFIFRIYRFTSFVTTLNYLYG